jgi:hypothetical protein
MKLRFMETLSVGASLSIVQANIKPIKIDIVK